LGGRFFSSRFCERHAGREQVCTHAVDCSLRVLWNTVQTVLHEVLGKTSLRDLLCSESSMQDFLAGRGMPVFCELKQTPKSAELAEISQS
jgi:hypothetical protein